MAVVAVSDLDGAKAFYGDTVGVRPSGIDEPGGVLYTGASGSQLLVYQSGYAGGNQATAASWQVDDLEGEIETLQAKGVSFEEYDTAKRDHEVDLDEVAKRAADLALVKVGVTPDKIAAEKAKLDSLVEERATLIGKVDRTTLRMPFEATSSPCT